MVDRFLYYSQWSVLYFRGISYAEFERMIARIGENVLRLVQHISELCTGFKLLMLKSIFLSYSPA